MRDYWTRLATELGVPKATGLQGGEEYTADYAATMGAVRFALTGRVLDIGCGTGRLAAIMPDEATAYVGCDVTPAMVDYATAHGRYAVLIEGPESFKDWEPESFDRICMNSVFTHIDRTERQKYLAVVARLLVPGGEALIDIFPGEDGGGIGFTTASVAGFETDLEVVGLTVASTTSLDYDGTGAHMFYRLRKGVE